MYHALQLLGGCTRGATTYESKIMTVISSVIALSFPNFSTKDSSKTVSPFKTCNSVTGPLVFVIKRAQHNYLKIQVRKSM